MEFCQFELVQYGIFDSRVKMPDITESRERTVEFYEIEIFTNSFNSVSYINDVPYDYPKGRLLCAKPGQRRYSRLHFCCYFLHIIPKNEKAKKLLDSLPDAATIGEISGYVKILNKMIRTDFSNKDIAHLSLMASTAEILSLILRDINIPNFQTGVINNKKALLLAEKHLRKNYQNNIDLKELASVANISPIYFHKLFTSYFGKTPNKYLLDLRISHAKTRLLKDEYSLTDIAFECGFTSQSYFCYKFKSVMGCSPLEYRKQQLSKAEI